MAARVVYMLPGRQPVVLDLERKSNHHERLCDLVGGCFKTKPAPVGCPVPGVVLYTSDKPKKTLPYNTLGQHGPMIAVQAKSSHAHVLDLSDDQLAAVAAWLQAGGRPAPSALPPSIPPVVQPDWWRMRKSAGMSFFVIQLPCQQGVSDPADQGGVQFRPEKVVFLGRNDSTVEHLVDTNLGQLLAYAESCKPGDILRIEAYKFSPELLHISPRAMRRPASSAGG